MNAVLAVELSFSILISVQRTYIRSHGLRHDFGTGGGGRGGGVTELKVGRKMCMRKLLTIIIYPPVHKHTHL